MDFSDYYGYVDLDCGDYCLDNFSGTGSDDKEEYYSACYYDNYGLFNDEYFTDLCVYLSFYSCYGDDDCTSAIGSCYGTDTSTDEFALETCFLEAVCGDDYDC